MAEGISAGHANQKRRTRKDLLQAAVRLMKQGRSPSMEEIAEEALVSRATAYRYFASADAVLLEAAIDITIPDAGAIFGDVAADPVVRLERVDTALHDALVANETQFRMMLVHTLQRAPGEAPARQNRRTPLIEEALAPARHELRPAALKTLVRALALVIGTEAMVVFKDVLQLDDAEARRVKRWAIRALVDAARKPPAGG